MHYLGGKFHVADQIAAYLHAIREPGQPYWEPFVGAGSVLARVRGLPIYASDANAYLIEMWRALQEGWIPPDDVTEAEYYRARDGDCYPALRAFIGFGCSWGGKWFGGYARGEGRNYAETASRGLLDKLAQMEREVIFFYADFLMGYTPDEHCLIYCDPPYAGTTGYDAIGDFYTGAFWERARRLEAHGHTVIVSEYAAPDDFSCVLEMPTRTDMRHGDGTSTRIERLFRWGEHPRFQRQLEGL